MASAVLRSNAFAPHASSITEERPPPEGLDQVLPNPGLPRANVTVDREHPEGTYLPPQDLTVLQQHLSFWDGDSDGVIWPLDTYRGFRRLGFNPLVSSLAIPIIHGTFSFWTWDSWVPRPSYIGFPVMLKNVHRTKHGSDSESFDTEGRFVPEKFEEIFSKYDRGAKGGLTLKELNQMVAGNRNINDPMGWTAGWLEWNTLYLLAARDSPRGRLVMKDDIRGAIDGTLFFKLAKQVERGDIKRAGLFKAGFAPVHEEKPREAAERKEE